MTQFSHIVLSRSNDGDNRYNVQSIIFIMQCSVYSFVLPVFLSATQNIIIFILYLTFSINIVFIFSLEWYVVYFILFLDIVHRSEFMSFAFDLVELASTFSPYSYLYSEM